ncbi:MAG: PAS domain S-box protein [Chloroflexi bacterium]|nr:PAS domain S-box protein [Chloroflexota bacterium]
MKNKDTDSKLFPSLLVIIFAILTAGIVVAGYLYYSNYSDNYKSQVENQLSSIASLKSGQIVQWRKERIVDANQFFANPAFSILVQRYLENPDDPDARLQLKTWLNHLQSASGQYAKIFLLDTNGVGRIFAPDTAEPVPRHIPGDAQRALQSGEITILDLDSDADTLQPHMVVLVPIYKAGDGSQSLGVVVMRIDPYRYLYPLIQEWPTPSKTAETLIVRRDGNYALFLNELRFQKDTALKLRSSLNNLKMPAVQAALGHEGIMEGIDYRNVPVIADIHQIPDSPWYMVARIDKAEVYAPLAQMLWVVISLVVILLIGAGAGTGLIWRQQNLRILKERVESAEALSQSESRYRELFESASLAVFRSTLDSKVIMVNPKFASLFGYESPEEVRSMVKDTATDLFADPHFRGEIVRSMQDNPDINKFEVLYRRKDGSTFWGELTLRIYSKSDGATFLEGFIEDITVRKETDQKLIKSEERFRNVFDNSAIGKSITSIDGVVSVNQAMADMLGYTKEELDNIKWQDISHPDDLDETSRKLAQLQATSEKSARFIKRYIKKDGTVVWADVNTVLQRDRDGKQLYYITTVVDITERKLAVEKVFHERDRAQGYLDTVETIIVSLNSEGRITLINRKGCQLFGCREDDLLGQLWFTTCLPQPDGMENVYPVFLQLMEGEIEHNALLRDEKERIIGTLSSGEDITEREQAVKALQASEEKYRSLVEEADAGIASIDLDGKLMLVNNSVCRWVGATRPDLLGRPFADFLHPEDLPGMTALFLNALGGDSTDHAIEFRIISRDRQIMWLHTNPTTIIMDGKIVGFNAIMHDITDRKSAEEKLLQSYESLKKTLNDSIDTMVKIVELRDPYTAGHQQKVADLAVAIAREMKFEGTQIEQLRMAAIIHDIGKIYVPSDILSKPGKLSDMEFNLIKTHAQNGYDIIKGMDFPGAVAETVLQHHERLDGSGYPNGLKAEDTLMKAKILAVADVVEALASHRPYRPALGVDKALEEISKNMGRLYDPDVAAACLKLFTGKSFKFAE